MTDSSDAMPQPRAPDQEPEPMPMPAEPLAIGLWLRRGARTAFLMRPDWRGLRATPAAIGVLILIGLALVVLVERLYIVGPARFYGPALMAGWLPTLVTAWACWCLVPEIAGHASGTDARAPDAMSLFALQSAQALALWVALALVQVPLLRADWLSPEALGPWGAWLAGIAPLAWSLAALSLLLWRGGRGSAARRGGAIALVCATHLASTWAEPLRLWTADEKASAAADAGPMKLTQELFELQAATLDRRLAAVVPQRPGRIDVYALTFAPYADEDVFLRESHMVAGVMAERFGAEGRTLQLVNHRGTQGEWPWATPLNLQRAIEHIAHRMDRDEDILFIHLTSHGALSGSLASSFWPLSTESLTPPLLKAALDAAGIRHRIVSVSACYSGSWIEPLTGEHTLVMSAADAEHTSFGCGRGSELTFFGRAMFDEQLRSKTLSFEAAHAQARSVIEQREKQAGKDDGYSNPQIRIGAAMRQHLLRLESELGTAAR
ncbi:MAG: C13 family peptidase [Burkholderiaceae bacterium]